MRHSIVKQLMASLLVAAACGLVACGGGSSKTSGQSSQTQTGQGAQTSADTRSRGGGSSGSGGAAGSQSGAADARGGAAQTGSGGAAPPSVKRSVRKRTLLRYLTIHYRQQVWYPMLKRLRINGGHVRVYLDFSPANDNEIPPLLACKAVLSYGGPVNQVSVYGNPTPQGKLIMMKHCQGSLPPPGAGVSGR